MPRAAYAPYCHADAAPRQRRYAICALMPLMLLIISPLLLLLLSGFIDIYATLRCAMMPPLLLHAAAAAVASPPSLRLLPLRLIRHYFMLHRYYADITRDYTCLFRRPLILPRDAADSHIAYDMPPPIRRCRAERYYAHTMPLPISSLPLRLA